MTIVLKSFLILAISMCLALNSFAQFQFPDSAARWVQVYKLMTTPPPLPVFTVQERFYYCVNGLDTVINSTNYTKLEKCSGGYKGALRDDNGRVYYMPADSLQEFVLYDFNVSEGDTVHNVYYENEFQQDTWVVDMVVSSIQQNSDFGGRKQIYIGNIRWIEGIGADAGLLTGDWINISGWQLEMECMSHLDTIRFGSAPSGTPGNCALDTYVEEIGRTDLNIYPNPTSGMISIDSREIISLSVCAIDGRRIELSDNQVSGSTLDLSFLPSGLYLLDITTEQGRFSQKIIKE